MVSGRHKMANLFALTRRRLVKIFSRSDLSIARISPWVRKLKSTLRLVVDIFEFKR